MDFHWTIGAMPYGERWRQSRKLLHAHVHSGAASAYQPVQMSSARRFVLDLLQNKNDKDVLPLLVRTNFGKTIIQMTYGIDVKHQVDEYVSLPEEVLHALNVATTPGRFLVDIIPIRLYFSH
jgi:cytochrome P450